MTNVISLPRFTKIVKLAATRDSEKNTKIQQSAIKSNDKIEKKVRDRVSKTGKSIVPSSLKGINFRDAPTSLANICQGIRLL